MGKLIYSFNKIYILFFDFFKCLYLTHNNPALPITRSIHMVFHIMLAFILCSKSQEILDFLAFVQKICIEIYNYIFQQQPLIYTYLCTYIFTRVLSILLSSMYLLSNIYAYVHRTIPILMYNVLYMHTIYYIYFFYILICCSFLRFLASVK